MFFGRKNAKSDETHRGRIARRYQILHLLYFLIITESGEQIALPNVHCQLGDAGLADLNDLIEVTRRPLDFHDNWQWVSFKVVSFAGFPPSCA